MSQESKQNIIEVGKTYRSLARGEFTVISYEPDEPSELRYTCSDRMFRDKYGRAFPEPLCEQDKKYNVIW